MDAEDDNHRDAPVPGVVRLMTSTPLEVPFSQRWGAPAVQLEMQPWLLGASAILLLTVLLATRRRRRR